MDTCEDEVCRDKDGSAEHVLAQFEVLAALRLASSATLVSWPIYFPTGRACLLVELKEVELGRFLKKTQVESLASPWKRWAL